MVNPTTVRRITRDVNTLAGTDGFAYFAADGAYLGHTIGTIPTDWAYAVATHSRITQKIATAIVAATDDKRDDLDAWFDTHQDVLTYLGAEVDRRRS